MAALFGLAIVGAAFLLSWAAEVAQLDISAGLAIAVLALIAVLERSHSVEISFLAVASLDSLSLPLKRSITLVDSAVLIALFVAYSVRISRAPAGEPHLVGPALSIGGFPQARRRLAVVTMFAVAAGTVILCAEHFAGPWSRRERSWA